MRYIMGTLLTLSLLAALPSAANAAGPGSAIILCGIVAANPVTSGEGSGPRTYQLQVTSGPPGAASSPLFGVAAAIPLPTVGGYLCGEFQGGVPMMGLVALLRTGDPGYVTSSLPSTSTQSDASVPTTPIEFVVAVLLFALAALGAVLAMISGKGRLSAAP